MKITVELNEVELRLISFGVSEEVVNEELGMFGQGSRLLVWSVIEQLKERASKKLLRMEPGKHKFYLSELIVLEQILLGMHLYGGIEDTFRNQLIAKLNKKIHGANIISKATG